MAFAMTVRLHTYNTVLLLYHRPLSWLLLTKSIIPESKLLAVEVFGAVPHRMDGSLAGTYVYSEGAVHVNYMRPTSQPQSCIATTLSKVLLMAAGRRLFSGLASHPYCTVQ